MRDRIRRALLFMPGDDRHKIEKGAGLPVDSVIMDLEDGVALDQKQSARQTTREALQAVEFGETEKLVRINPVHGGLWQTDIAETIAGNPDGYVIPKVESAEQVQRTAAYLSEVEPRLSIEDGSTYLIAIVESALGVLNLREIAESNSRLVGLAFGAEDLAGDIGAIRTPDAWEVFYARSAVVLHAKAYSLQAIDTPHVDISAEDSQLIAETEQAHYMGYTGKFAVHPRQIEPIQAAFTPTEEEIRRAQALILAHANHEAAGQGVFNYEGKMVDQPMILAAEYTLARARAAGITVDE